MHALEESISISVWSESGETTAMQRVYDEGAPLRRGDAVGLAAAVRAVISAADHHADRTPEWYARELLLTRYAAFFAKFPHLRAASCLTPPAATAAQLRAAQKLVASVAPLFARVRALERLEVWLLNYVEVLAEGVLGAEEGLRFLSCAPEYLQSMQKFSIVLKRILPDKVYEKLLLNHYKL